jgi:hypothetical protein
VALLACENQLFLIVHPLTKLLDCMSGLRTSAEHMLYDCERYLQKVPTQLPHRER